MASLWTRLTQLQSDHRSFKVWLPLPLQCYNRFPISTLSFMTLNALVPFQSCSSGGSGVQPHPLTHGNRTLPCTSAQYYTLPVYRQTQFISKQEQFWWAVQPYLRDTPRPHPLFRQSPKIQKHCYKKPTNISTSITSDQHAVEINRTI